MEKEYLTKEISEDILHNIKHFNTKEVSIISQFDEILKGYFVLEKTNAKTSIVIPSFLMITAKKALISSLTLLQSLQLPACYPLIRNILENSIYSYYINNNNEIKAIYLNRDNDVESKKKNRSQFSMKEIFKFLEIKSPSWLNEFKLQYENSIDKGAHPNLETFRPYVKSNHDFSYSWDLFETKSILIEGVSKDIIAAGRLSLKIYNDLYDEIKLHQKQKNGH
ncbi:hypothetical protein [Marispirochaeta sp.]|uniref:hypothetical protein n=1 Tax=Marispirochaeta sp. TaxID=2038653 RepID=UPI0029C7B451|nr:hypothetical protein [Marispirochaeta sp.]